jgi:hypothetical protein
MLSQALGSCRVIRLELRFRGYMWARIFMTGIRGAADAWMKKRLFRLVTN